MKREKPGTKANAFIFHGAYGNPRKHWFQWLKRKLEARGFTARVPRFPTPRKQSLANWLAALGKDAERLNEKTILVGHSAGCAFALRLLEKTKPDCKVKIRAVFLVAPFARFLGDARFDAPNRTFLNKPFNWRKIRASARRFVVFASRDDPYVPIVQARFVARKLGAELIVVKNAGHFNKAAGYTSFPALLEKIKKISGV